MVAEWDVAGFSEAAAPGLLRVVDMWAPWCGPCKQFLPVFSEVAGVLGDRFEFGKVNVDDSPELAQQFGVMSIPTVVVVDAAGGVVARWVGARSALQLRSDLEALA